MPNLHAAMIKYGKCSKFTVAYDVLSAFISRKYLRGVRYIWATMSHPHGLVATVYPRYFKTTTGFGNLTISFAFMTGFDDIFMQSLGVSTNQPTNLGWTERQKNNGVMLSIATSIRICLQKVHSPLQYASQK